MTNDDDGGPAFPSESATVYDHNADFAKKVDAMRGMTLRDYFAAHADRPWEGWAREWMESRGLNFDDRTPGDAVSVTAAWRYALADAMIAERGRSQ